MKDANKRQTFTTKGPLKIRRTFAKDSAGADIPDQAITTLMGYPILWAPQTSGDRGGYKVRLAPGSANFSDSVMALFHHDFSAIIGNTANNTLRIGKPDDTGVPVEIDLPDTTTGRDVAELVDKGYIGGMSFSMANGFEDFTTSQENGTEILLCTRFTVDEVTVTGTPAFTGTTIGVKDDADDNADKDNTARVNNSDEKNSVKRARARHYYLVKMQGSSTASNHSNVRGDKVIDTKALREEFANVSTKAETLIQKAADEKRANTTEEQAEIDAAFARLEQIKSINDNAIKLAGTAFTAGKVEQVQTPANDSPDIRVIDDTIAEHTRQFRALPAPARQAYNRAMTKWAATGIMENQFATITTATASGALLPKDVTAPLIVSAPNVFRQALSLWGVQPMQTPSTRDVSLPVATPSAGGVVAENASTETENEPSLNASILLHPQTYQSGSSWFSNQQLLAVDFDLFAEMLPALSYSKELGLESAGITQIVGDANITQSVTCATDSGFTYNDLVNLNRVLPKRYNFMKVIVLSHDAYTAAEKLVTTTGYPILNADAQNQELKRFNGTPVIYSDYLSTFGTARTIGFVVSLIGFRLRDCDQTQVQRYTQYPGKPNQTGYNLFGYHAIGYDPSAMATFKTP